MSRVVLSLWRFTRYACCHMRPCRSRFLRLPLLCLYFCHSLYADSQPVFKFCTNLVKPYLVTRTICLSAWLFMDEILSFWFLQDFGIWGYVHVLAQCNVHCHLDKNFGYKGHFCLHYKDSWTLSLSLEFTESRGNLRQKGAENRVGNIWHQQNLLVWLRFTFLSWIYNGRPPYAKQKKL